MSPKIVEVAGPLLFSSVSYTGRAGHCQCGFFPQRGHLSSAQGEAGRMPKPFPGSCSPNPHPAVRSRRVPRGRWRSRMSSNKLGTRKNWPFHCNAQEYSIAMCYRDCHRLFPGILQQRIVSVVSHFNDKTAGKTPQNVIIAGRTWWDHMLANFVRLSVSLAFVAISTT